MKSLRSTLCLLYEPRQIAFALVFLAIIIMDLQPTASGSSSSSNMRNFSSSNSGSSSETWIDIFEKDIEDNVLHGT